MKYIKHLILLSMLSLIVPNVALAERNDAQKEQSETKKRKGKKRKGKKRKGKKRKGKNKLRRYPLKVNARPLVLPTGLNEVSAALNFTSFSQGKKDVTSSAMNISFKRGIIPKLEIGASTGLLLNPEVDWSSSFTLLSAYKIAGRRKGLSLAAQVAMPLNFGENQDVVSGLSAGLATRYRINKQVALHTGEGLINLSFSGDPNAIINIPVGVAFQINKRINVRADTRIISFGGGQDTVSIADSLPLQLRGLYTIRRAMDAGLAVNTNLVADEGWSAIAVFNYRM
ncbi:MAG: hypothetical protein CMH49_03225 [Myxococcales bacterium]|nr:hypothetical protein [Myxococcales bacterium]